MKFRFVPSRFLPLPLAPLVLFLATGLVWGEFTISGNFPELAPGTKLTLLRQDLDTRNQISEGELVIRADHTFTSTFGGEAGLFNLELPGGGILPLAIADGQELQITRNSNSATGFTVTGSPDTDILHAYEAFRKDSLVRLVYPPRARLNAATDAGIPAEQLAPLAQAEVDGYNAHKRELNDFTIEKAGTSIALYATSLRWDSDYRLAELQDLVSAFAEKYPHLAITRSMQERIRLFTLTAIGAMGAPLSGKDLDGTAYSLQDFRGRVVLVDFWASWCVPCRVENRHYPELLEKYSGNGFSVFGVNLDDSRSAWARASQQDGVTWPQISDLMGLKSPMAQDYNVTALPVSFLLDEEGRILARNLRGDKLTKKLEELFGRTQ
jgi:thiol-disulfide isomerase/thioredoxin